MELCAHHFEAMEAAFERPFNELGRDGVRRIVDRATRGCVEAPRAQTAYILATAYWESARTFAPVREGLAKSDAEARAYVDQLFADGRIKTNYALPAANGQSFYGRGYVQLTWERNYRNIGDHLVGDPTWFYHRPDDVMHPDIAAIIMVRGMVDGIFTEHRLGDFINAQRTDFVNARLTVNRMDRAETIAEYAERFLRIISAGR